MSKSNAKYVDLGNNSWIEHMDLIPKSIRITNEDYDRLWLMHPAQVNTIKIYGKETPLPRWDKVYGHDYNYSRTDHKSEEMTDPSILRMVDWAQNDSGYIFGGIIMNWYQDGRDYIGKHSDDEKQLLKGAPIYSFSFGETRTFRITGKHDDYQRDFELRDGSLIIMGGDMQKHFKHEVPKRLKRNGTRINITMRVFKDQEQYYVDDELK
jgi:alkylated DNA repair dioxygenase AlkB